MSHHHREKEHHKEKKEKKVEHPDITYLKQDEIGLVLTRALKETY